MVEVEAFLVRCLVYDKVTDILHAGNGAWMDGFVRDALRKISCCTNTIFGNHYLCRRSDSTGLLDATL